MLFLSDIDSAVELTYNDSVVHHLAMMVDDAAP